MALNTPLSTEQLITNTTELQAVQLVNQSGNTSAQRYQGTHSAPIATLIQLCSHQTKTTDTNNLHREGWLSPRWMHFQRSRLQVNHSNETSSPLFQVFTVLRYLFGFRSPLLKTSKLHPLHCQMISFLHPLEKYKHTRGSLREIFPDIWTTAT